MHLTTEQLRKLTNQQIEQLQNKKFEATCKYILPNVPYYANLFKQHGIDEHKLKTPQDWQKQGLPLIKKTTYLKNPREFIVKTDKTQMFQQYKNYTTSFKEKLKLYLNPIKTLKDFYTPKMLIFSGGTESGNPTPVILTTQQKENLMKTLKVAGDIIFPRLQMNEKIGMNLFPYAPHLGWHAVHHALDINADLNLCTAAGGTIPTERLVLLADKMKPNIICGMSDYLRNRFLPLAIEKGITLPEKLLFINGAQKMLNPEREKISQQAKQLGAKDITVLDIYGASEIKEAILPECTPNNGYHHIAPMTTIIKTVQVNHATSDLIDDWNFADNGYAASWTIDGAGTQIAGYLIGDKYDKITTDKCWNCGLNVTRIHGINRIRETEAQIKLTGTVEEKIKGTRVNLVEIRETALRLPEVKEAQVYLNRKKGLLELRYVSDKPIKHKLQQLFAHTEIRPKLVETTMKKLEGDKIKFEAVKIE